MNFPPPMAKLGYANPFNWPATLTHYSYRAPGIKDTMTIKDLKPGIDTTARLYYSSRGGQFSGAASPYLLQGHAWTTGADSRLTGSTTFRDELYLETYNHLPAIIEFNFDLQISIDPGDHGHTFCRVSMWCPRDREGKEFHYLDGKIFFSTAHRTVTFSSAGIGSIGSRRYFPFNVTVWSNCWADHTMIKWSLTASSASSKEKSDFLHIYQTGTLGEKKLLRPDQYAVFSRNALFPSRNETYPKGATSMAFVPAPDPALIWK
jgi:hypothetical protein